MSKPQQEAGLPSLALVIDNHPASESSLLRRFSGVEGIAVVHARSREDIEDALRSAVFDAAVADGGMDRSDILDLPHVLGEIVSPPPGLILCGGADDTKLMRKAFLCGYVDYLGPASSAGAALFSSVARVAQRSRLEHEEAARQSEIAKQARRDPVTTLPNRAQLDFRLANLGSLDAPVRSLYRLALLRTEACDLVRGAFGAPVWDGLMRACAERLGETEGGLLGRFDADTFYLLWAGSRTGEDPSGVLADALAALSRETVMDRRRFSLPARAVAVEIPAKGDPAIRLDRAASLLFDEDHWDGIKETARLEVAAKQESFDAWFARSGAMSRMAAPVVAAPLLTEAHDTPPPGRLPDGESERRSDPRRRCLKRGALVLNNGFSTVDCVIRDLSRGGARISTEAHCFVPREVELLMHESGRRVRASRRWQVDEQVGLMFDVGTDAAA